MVINIKRLVTFIVKIQLLISFPTQVHSKGLKFGIYENYGNKTCEGYPGLIGHEKVDVTMFAEWGIDYIKVDGCYYDGYNYAKGK